MTLRRLLVCMICVGIWGMPCPIVLAQPSYEIHPMAVTRISGQWVFDGQYRQEKHQRTGINANSREKSLRFQESLELNLSGYAYHPNLAEWGVNLKMGLEQNRDQVDTFQQNSDGTLWDYSLYALMFKKKALTLHVTANQTQQTLDRSFARAIEMNQQVQSIELTLKKAISASFHLERRRLEETSDVRSDKKQTWFMALQLQDNRNTRWKTRLRFEREQTDQTSIAINQNGLPGTVLDLPDTRDQISMQNVWILGRGPIRPDLIGSARIMKRRGFFQNDQIAIHQRLTLHHTRNFQTYYEGQFSNDTTSTQQDKLIEGRTGLNWRIYDSLNIDTYLQASDRQLENGREKRKGAYADLAYRKKVPIGRYRSTMKISREIESETFADSVQNIRDESITLAGLGAVTLSHPNIQSASVVVTDATQTITYIQGLDYILTTFGPFLQIARTATGTIADGQTVLVDYVVHVSDRNEHVTDTFHWTHRLKLNNLPFPMSVYLTYLMQNQVLTSGIDPGNLDKYDVLIMGADITLGELQVGGEIEQRKQRLFPNARAIRLHAGYSHQIRGDMTLVANGGYENIEYDENLDANTSVNFQKNLFGDVGITLKANRFLLLRLDGSYRTSRGRQVDDLARLGTQLIFRKGTMDVTINASYSVFTQQDDHGDNVMFSVRIKRTF